MTGTAVKQTRLRKPTLKTDLFDDIRKDEIKAKVDIVALFAHFGVALTKKGKSYTACCPWHDDTSPSLSVDREKGLYNCFGCGESGDVVTLVEKMKGLSFSEAMHYLKEFAKIPEQRRSTEVEPKEADAQKIEVVLPDAEEITPLRTNSSENDEKESPQNSSTTEETQLRKNEDETSIQSQITPQEISLTQTLDAVADYYHSTFLGSKEAQDYFRSRGLVSKLVAQFRIGYCDGTLKEKISGEQFTELQKAGVFSEKGYEHFKGCIVIPLTDRDNRALSFYGRRITDKEPKHLYLPGEHKAILNEKALVVYDQIILTESVIDALSLISVGIQNVSSIYGTNGLTKLHIAKLHEHAVKEIVLAFDNDDPGRMAAHKQREILLNEGFAIREIFPKGKDWNEDLCSGALTKEYITALIDTATTQQKPKEAARLTTIKTGGVYRFTGDGICYEPTGVKDFFRSNTRIVITAETERGNYHDRCDLYSAKSRVNYALNLSRESGIEQKTIEKDLSYILDYLIAEYKRNSTDATTETVEMSDEEIACGMELLQSTDLFERIVRDMNVLGYVGEEKNKILMYIVAHSYLLNNPFSVIVTSQSASGKSALVETVEEMMPKERLLALSSFSDMALHYAKNINRTFMTISEKMHKEEIEYQLRDIQTKHKLNRMLTMKDIKSGEMEAKQVSTEAYTAIAMTTTETQINQENASRCFIIQVDESAEQTARVLREQRKQFTLEGCAEKDEQAALVIKRHHAAARLLEPVPVIIPYVDQLHYPAHFMRVRRDHNRFLYLIAAICHLRQKQKQLKTHKNFTYIEADEVDYEIAYDQLVNNNILSNVSELPQGARDLYGYMREYARKTARKKNLAVNEISMTQRDIRECTGFGQMWVKRHLRYLVDYEYISIVRGGTTRTKGHYRIIVDEVPEKIDTQGITTPQEVQVIMKRMEENRTQQV